MKHVLEGMEESVRSCYCDLNVVAGGSTSSNEELVQTLANCEFHHFTQITCIPTCGFDQVVTGPAGSRAMG